VSSVKSYAFERAARETGVREQEGAQRSITQAGKPVGQWATGLVREHGMCKNKRFPAAEKGDFANPGQSVWPYSKQTRFVFGGFDQAVLQ
jgi:hypothetical protein